MLLTLACCMNLAYSFFSLTFTFLKCRGNIIIISPSELKRCLANKFPINVNCFVNRRTQTFPLPAQGSARKDWLYFPQQKTLLLLIKRWGWADFLMKISILMKVYMWGLLEERNKKREWGWGEVIKAESNEQKGEDKRKVLEDKRVGRSLPPQSWRLSLPKSEQRKQCNWVKKGWKPIFRPCP